MASRPGEGHADFVKGPLIEDGMLANLWGFHEQAGNLREVVDIGCCAAEADKVIGQGSSMLVRKGALSATMRCCPLPH